MLGGRKLAGARLAAISTQGIRALYQALAAGEQVAVLPDQEPQQAGSAAAFAPFFGVPALTMTLLPRLARKTGAAVFFIFAARLPGGRYRMHGFTADPALVDADAQRALDALNSDVERCVRMFPEQYQWTYRRFKCPPPGGTNPYKTTR
jgi:KDO2-lipid IV(A) lauroyltransferase